MSVIRFAEHHDRTQIARVAAAVDAIFEQHKGQPANTFYDELWAGLEKLVSPPSAQDLAEAITAGVRPVITQK
ncbi:hypothetical protein L1080_032425 [Rhodococcus sp. MSC1_016]|jgi:hypothetical protein|uniref:hypothetical protein n=1 Tax=Rhodococcus sp. MSC1_016 TaxID=2909266 RepID=UPI00202DC48F|nr:hypothetical protein [Rhodococcus sp. MSC1_016]